VNKFRRGGKEYLAWGRRIRGGVFRQRQGASNKEEKTGPISQEFITKERRGPVRLGSEKEGRELRGADEGAKGGKEGQGWAGWHIEKEGAKEKRRTEKAARRKAFLEGERWAWETLKRKSEDKKKTRRGDAVACVSMMERRGL